MCALGLVIRVLEIWVGYVVKGNFLLRIQTRKVAILYEIVTYTGNIYLLDRFHAKQL